MKTMLKTHKAEKGEENTRDSIFQNIYHLYYFWFPNTRISVLLFALKQDLCPDRRLLPSLPSKESVFSYLLLAILYILKSFGCLTLLVESFIASLTQLQINRIFFIFLLLYQLHYCCHTALGTELVNGCISTAANTITCSALGYMRVIPVDNAVKINFIWH